MLNQVMLVGRIKEISANKNIILASQRQYKNADGVYETDFIPIYIIDTMKDNIIQYCNTGDIVGIRGRLQQDSGDKKIKVIAEKVSFLSSRHTEDDTEEEA